MALETRPNKRPRVVDGVDAVSPATGKRSEKYWFDDGNVILRVEDVLFRVYRGLLSRHSSVFLDMFAIPQPPTPDEDMVIDGCSVIVLSGDAWEDWENFFRVLYDCDTKYKEEGALDHKALVSMLRLGHKYQFDFFFNEAMARLAVFFPTTVDKWAGISKQFTRNILFQLLGIMLEIGNETLLPTIYFCCASFRAEQIFKIYRKKRDHSVSQLKELERILLGRAQILSAVTEQRLKWASMHSNIEHRRKCLSDGPPVSAVTCHEMILNVCKQDAIQPVPHVTMERPQVITDLIFGGGLCRHCAEAITADQEESRVALWAKLPSYFGLPDWKEVEAP